MSKYLEKHMNHENYIQGPRFYNRRNNKKGPTQLSNVSD